LAGEPARQRGAGDDEGGASEGAGGPSRDPAHLRGTEQRAEELEPALRRQPEDRADDSDEGADDDRQETLADPFPRLYGQKLYPIERTGPQSFLACPVEGSRLSKSSKTESVR